MVKGHSSNRYSNTPNWRAHLQFWPERRQQRHFEMLWRRLKFADVMPNPIYLPGKVSGVDLLILHIHNSYAWRCSANTVPLTYITKIHTQCSDQLISSTRMLTRISVLSESEDQNTYLQMLILLKR
uniref:Uncharacterized protein n=1 Tax=Ditylenchus dipsaci TaxID=166011 RepID=A0A915EB83_9BILA